VAWCAVFDYTMKIPKTYINKEYQTVKILTFQGVFAQSDGWRYEKLPFARDSLSKYKKVEAGYNPSHNTETLIGYTTCISISIFYFWSK
jgi:hypothetical protein